MLTDDYLMRWIRLATAAVARVAGLKAATLYTDALFLLDRTVEQMAGLDGSLVGRLDDEGVIALLTGPDGLDTDRLILIADIVREQGEVFVAQRMVPEANWRFQRALHFYLVAEQHGGPTRVEPPAAAIDALSAQLWLQLPPERLFDLHVYYDEGGRFKDAAAAIDRLMIVAGPQGDLTLAADEFYARLQHLSDAELGAGGISRSWLERRLTHRPPAA